MRTRAVILTVLAGALLCSPAPGEGAVRGEPFGNPAAVFPMPADWAGKPVRHESWSEKAEIAITLEQDVYQLFLPFIRRYEKERGLRIAVQEGTCGISAGALARKAVEIGGFCCPPGREDRLPGLRFHTLGIVAKAIIVNPANALDGLSLQQVRDIFAGKAFRWSDVRTPQGKRGPERPIRTFARFHCPGRPGHWRLLLDNEDLFGLQVNEVRTIADMVAQVASDPGAIGWEVMGMVEHYANLGRVKAVAVDGHLPSDVAALAAGRYPIYRTYNITTWGGAGREDARVRGLVEFLVKESERIDPRYGFAPARLLRQAGWRFNGDELIGEPR